MRRYLPILTVVLAWTGAAHAQGLLVPEDKTLSPLEMVQHHVNIAIEDQVATTKVEQTFHNPSDRQIEATYVFPVPKGAGVNQFAMWVDGKKVTGELVPADQARQTYTDIVRRTQDPGLLEYVDSNLFRLRLFPVPANGDQKVALSFTSVASQEAGLVEYIYPLKKQATKEFSVQAVIKSQHGVQNVYSSSHAVVIDRKSDREVRITLKKEESAGKDFQLFYQPGDKDVGLTALMYRPVSGDEGHFLMLLSPKMNLPREQSIPRDLVLVLDTSGSMQGTKIEQARKALKHCLGCLRPGDRFGLIRFATTVTAYQDRLVESNAEQVARARKWVDRLEANGSTAIND